MKKLCSRKADFERIKNAYFIWKNSKFTEISECYKACSDRKKRTYSDYKYLARKLRNGHDFRIVYASINIYTFGYIFSGPENNNVFCYVLPHCEICEYVSVLSGTESGE